MAEDEDIDEKPKKKSKGSALKIILIFLVVMFLVGGTVAGLYVGGIIGASPVSEDGEEAEQEEEEKPVGAAIYIPMDPAFVVNFAEGSKAKFLQVTLEVMTRSSDMQKHIQTHAPVIRNNLLLLFSSQTYESVSTLEGKEALRERALETIQEILEAETGDPGIEAVYFTSFVMQ